MCPFCGEVLYETGGGMRKGCVVGLTVFALLFASLFILILLIQIAHKLAR